MPEKGHVFTKYCHPVILVFVEADHCGRPHGGLYLQVRPYKTEAIFPSPGQPCNRPDFCECRSPAGFTQNPLASAQGQDYI